MKDIGNLCTHCHKDTSFGSGRFVNRIPSTTDDEDGYMCAECYTEPNISPHQPKPDKPRLSNDQFIALSCELAHERVEEEHTGDECADLLAKDGAESCYTEDGQEFFDVMYDHYQDILSKYLDGQEPDKAEHWTTTALKPEPEPKIKVN